MIRLSDMSCSRGAPMGRHSKHMTGLTDPQFFLERVPMVDGGYDTGGAYWGSPDNLWCAEFKTPLTETTLVFYFIRAYSRDEAMKEVRVDYPTAKFFPATGSVIAQTIEMLENYLEGERNAADEDDEDDEDEQDRLLMLESEIEDLRLDLETEQELLEEHVSNLGFEIVKDTDTDSYRYQGEFETVESGLFDTLEEAAIYLIREKEM